MSLTIKWNTEREDWQRVKRRNKALKDTDFIKKEEIRENGNDISRSISVWLVLNYERNHDYSLNTE